ncbi:hypothetical protein D9M68_1000210 [compost metagenome]
MPEQPQESFPRVYFREMFFNVAIASLAIAASALGLVLGLAIGGDQAPGIGGLVGLGAGIAAATVLYRRRHARARPQA